MLRDLPIIPLWFQKTSVLFGHNVKTYVRNIISVLRLPEDRPPKPPSMVRQTGSRCNCSFPAPLIKWQEVAPSVTSQ